MTHLRTISRPETAGPAPASDLNPDLQRKLLCLAVALQVDGVDPEVCKAFD